MKESEAVDIVSILNAAFPGLTLESESSVIWVRLIRELNDAAIATTVALDFARNLDRPPTIATFRAAYLGERKRHFDEEARTHGLEEAGGPQKLPEWVKVYMWMRNSKDMRTLPQQEGWEHEPLRLSHEEYEQMRDRWLAETGGKGPHVMPLTGQTFA